VEDGPIIHYLSAERDLVIDETTRKPVNAGLLSVGGAAFSDGSSFAALRNTRSPQGAVARTNPEPPAHALRDASINCGGFRSMTFQAIPASRNEAQAVAGLWRQFGAGQGVEPATLQTLVGAAATERAFKQTAPGRRILHLATHGFFLGDDCAPVIEGARAVGGLAGPASPASKPAGAARATGPRAIPENPLLLSGLALAGANRRSAAAVDEEDGILSAEEVAALNLQGVEWAVLSACDTGLGTVISREGVLGLRRAFQVAGVRTVIMSLWSVDDRATLEWMQRLYEARFRENLSTADAMRDASVQVIRARRSKGVSTNPFYWAAFVASGDWH
jgi:CHAT domain-containing protein